MEFPQPESKTDLGNWDMCYRPRWPSLPEVDNLNILLRHEFGSGQKDIYQPEHETDIEKQLYLRTEAVKKERMVELSLQSGQAVLIFPVWGDKQGS